MNNTNEPICVRHWFEPKATLGAPGPMWQECELCGKTLDQILANYISRKEVIEALNKKDWHSCADRKLCDRDSWEKCSGAVRNQHRKEIKERLGLE